MEKQIIMDIKYFSFRYKGAKKATLKEVNLPVYKNRVTAMIVPLGYGKTTLRSLNIVKLAYFAQKGGKLKL